MVPRSTFRLLCHRRILLEIKHQYYQEPVYDSDNFGLVDPETGLDGPDGIDNPGNILYYKPQRTGYRQNYSNNFGIL